jgi:hypothetical protein
LRFLFSPSLSASSRLRDALEVINKSPSFRALDSGHRLDNRAELSIFDQH